MSLFAALIIASAQAAVPIAAPRENKPAEASRSPNRGKATQALALGNLAALIEDDDYPASALRAHEQGTVHFVMDVGKDGRVTKCTVTISSGSTALDSATCRIVTTRARFRPARDVRGKAVKDRLSSRITWRIAGPVFVVPLPQT